MLSEFPRNFRYLKDGLIARPAAEPRLSGSEMHGACQVFSPGISWIGSRLNFSGSAVQLLQIGCMPPAEAERRHFERAELVGDFA